MWTTRGLTVNSLGSKDASYSNLFQNFLAAAYDVFLSTLALREKGGEDPYTPPTLQVCGEDVKLAGLLHPGEEDSLSWGCFHGMHRGEDMLPSCLTTHQGCGCYQACANTEAIRAIDAQTSTSHLHPTAGTTPADSTLGVSNIVHLLLAALTV